MKLARNIFSRHEFSRDKCSEIFPEYFEPLFRGSEKTRKIPAKFPANFPPPQKTIHRRASAGAQGEKFKENLREFSGEFKT